MVKAYGYVGCKVIALPPDKCAHAGISIGPLMRAADCSQIRSLDFPGGSYNQFSRGGGIMDFIWFILTGLVAGWLAGKLVKGGGFGVIGDIVVGVLGALIGGSLFSFFGVSVGGGLLGAILVATVGAILLIFILRLIKRA
jgi:uncharacterized membrane protein YeaQ/YmgE (transglycosylase-associated protein family)